MEPGSLRYYGANAGRLFPSQPSVPDTLPAAPYAPHRRTAVNETLTATDFLVASRFPVNLPANDENLVVTRTGKGRIIARPIRIQGGAGGGAIKIKTRHSLRGRKPPIIWTETGVAAPLVNPLRDVAFQHPI